MKKLIFLCLLSLSFSVLSFPASKVFSAEPIKIGLFLPEAGPLAVFARDIKIAADLAVREINRAGGIWDLRVMRRKKLEMVLCDTGQGPAAATEAANRAIHVNKVSALIGDLTFPNTLALMDVAWARKVPLVSYAATWLRPHEYKNPYFFKSSPGVPNYVSTLVGYASKVKNVKKFGVLVTDDSTGISYSSAARGFLKALGLGSIVVEKRFPRGVKDFGAYLIPIKDERPDGLFFVAPPSESGRVVRKAREIGLDKPIFTFERSIVSKTFFEVSGRRTKDVFMCSAYRPKIFTNKGALAFEKIWSQAYPYAPSDLSVNVYDAVKMLAFAIGRHGSEPEQIRSGLEGLKKYDGARGVLSFLRYGPIVKDMVISEWKKDKIVSVQVYEYSKKEREFVDKQEQEGPIRKD